jgi:hypothetical protein
MPGERDETDVSAVTHISAGGGMDGELSGEARSAEDLARLGRQPCSLAAHLNVNTPRVPRNGKADRPWDP